MKFSTIYDFIPDEGIVFTEPSMTDQSQAPDTDINRIVTRYEQTGLLVSPGQHEFETLQYGDATLLPDYETALELVRGVEGDFANLPSNVRAAFDHDPMQLLAALQDPSKKEQLIELGLIHKDEALNKVQENAQAASADQAAKNAKN